MSHGATNVDPLLGEDAPGGDVEGVGDDDGPTWIDNVGDGAAVLMASGADASITGGADGCVGAARATATSKPITATAPPWR